MQFVKFFFKPHLIAEIVLFLFLPIFCHSKIDELETVHKVASLYKRPITFLAIAESSVVSSFTSRYDGVFVQMGAWTFLDSLPNVVCLQKACTSKMLFHLGECEHFDLVFVKNHSNQLNLSYAKALYHLGENVFVLLDKKSFSLAPYLLAASFEEVLPKDEGFRLFFAHHSISYLKRTHWFEPASNLNSVRCINSTYDEKTQYKKVKKEQSINDWQPGINLITFKVLEGVLPDDKQLESEINRLYHIPHPDWMPNNIVVQGKDLVLIDGDPLEGGKEKTVHDEKMLELMVLFVKEKDAKKTKQNYVDILTYCRFKIHGKL